MEKCSKSMKEKLGFKYHISILCSGNTIKEKKWLEDAEKISEHIANNNMVLVSGASKEGLMGVTSRAAYRAGGFVYGVGLQDYEPTIYDNFTQWDGYSSYFLRINRIFELGDVFIALAGGLGTLHEILDVHINQFLGRDKKPIIILSPMAELYKHICKTVKGWELYWDKLPENIHFAKDYVEAIKILDDMINKFDEEGYMPDIYYPLNTAEEIYSHIKKNQEPFSILYEGNKFKVLPEVYPPNRFRSSLIFGEMITKELVTNKIIFDIGCSVGNLGITASKRGAKKVILCDINDSAILNTQENIQLLNVRNVAVRKSNVFSAFSKEEKADIIFFNPPFHKEKIEAHETKLKHSLSTNKFEVLDNFFRDVSKHLKKDGRVLLSFSNKDARSLEHLNKLMKDYEVKLLRQEYEGTPANYFLYEIRVKES